MKTDLYFKPTDKKEPIAPHIRVDFCFSPEGMMMIMKSNLTKNDIDLLISIVQCYDQKYFTLRDVRKHLFHMTGKTGRNTKYSTKALIDNRFIVPLIGRGYTYKINPAIIYGLF